MNRSPSSIDWGHKNRPEHRPKAIGREFLGLAERTNGEEKTRRSGFSRACGEVGIGGSGYFGKALHLEHDRGKKHQREPANKGSMGAEKVKENLNFTR